MALAECTGSSESPGQTLLVKGGGGANNRLAQSTCELSASSATAEVCDKLASEGEGCGVQSQHLPRSVSGNTALVSIHNPWLAVLSRGKHCMEKIHESGFLYW